MGPAGRTLRAWRGKRREFASDGLAARADGHETGLRNVRDGFEGLRAQLEAAREEVGALTAEVRAARGEAAELPGRIEELDRRLRATQTLVARSYEETRDWRGLVEGMRREPEYVLPWEERPLVTVTIPTFNRATTLCERALPTVLAQTYDHWECVIVGDALTDDTEERVNALGDPRVRFQNLPFRGPYPDDEQEFLKVAGMPAVRRACELAQGMWIARLDDDDEWNADHLDVLLSRARETRAEVVYGKWRLRDARNRRLLAPEFGEWPVKYGHFAFQAAIYHVGLRRLLPDMNTRFAGEPGDWNRARRMWEAGVRFAYVDRPVTTIWFTPRHAEAADRFDWACRTFGYIDEDSGEHAA